MQNFSNEVITLSSVIISNIYISIFGLSNKLELFSFSLSVDKQIYTHA